MSYIPRRFASTLPKFTATEAANEILQRFGKKPISIRTQFIDPNQAQLLSLTLGRPNLHRNVPVTGTAPPVGTPLPPGYHLAYFTPSILEKELGADGSDRTVNPLSPYTRRMWAGGELEWNQDPDQLLRIGQTVTEITEILSAEPKKLRNGNEMILVGVEKRFENEKGVALIDRRSVHFLPKPPKFPNFKRTEESV